MSKTLLFALLSLVIIVDGCGRRDAGLAMQRNLQAPPNSPKMLAAYMPWFGDRSHIDVGYSSNDPEVIRRQIDEASSMGISGFVVDWYGPGKAYTDSNFALMQQIAKEKHFQVALLFNEVDGQDSDASTDQAIAAFDRAYKAYIGPEAKSREAYLTHNGRPVIFIFPKGSHSDWNRVRQHVQDWSPPPLLIYKDESPAQSAAAFDGNYAWVHPHGEWAPDGSNWGKEYLENFYKKMKAQPDKIVVGAAWPGFDDTRAHWTLNRHMDPRCGKTLDDTLQISRDFAEQSGSMPFLMIDTWNDYEEGTAIERKAFKDCNANGQVTNPAPTSN